TDVITDAFADYYRTTILADETDPNKLHDLQSDLDGAQMYSPDQVKEFVKRYLNGLDPDRLHPILDQCAAVYVKDLGEDQQVDFKSKARGFVRTYAFLSSILPYNNRGWEERSIFLNFLIPKLPAPVEDDLSKGILETIDMDSYRVEKRAMRKIILPDEDAEIDPVPVEGGGWKGEAELDRLSVIIEEFNSLFGGIEWEDEDRVRQMITETIPAKVAEDTAFRNARKNSDRENARIEHDKALGRVMTSILKDDTELFKQFVDNPDFKRWLGDAVFEMAYEGWGE
ncbi:MAG: type I restriction endonuclease subunit R, partial [Chloroflexi bacterium]|nr:type I restriction endonuclease subunit R [Chloroflexota bacterium]